MYALCMERGAQQDAVAPLHCSGLSKENTSSYRRGPKIFLLHAPFKGTTLFGGELAKLQEANTKRAATFTVFPQPTAPPASYSTRPYVRRGRSFNDRKGLKKPGGRGMGQGRSTPSATSTKPGQSKKGQKTLTVSVSSDSKKREVESRDDAPQAPRKAKRNFRGDKNQGNKK